MRLSILGFTALTACGGTQTMTAMTDVKNMDGYESIHALLERCEAGAAMDPDAVGEEAVVELYERVSRVYTEVVKDEDPCDAVVAQL